ncbi:MAG: shikimate dehydrogenase [Bacteroidales bacterium]|nr:shikimate dehydrogenase [Bacteroidales bacterium]
MSLYGLIGHPLTHSWSAKYFNKKFENPGLNDHEYRLFPLTSADQILQLIHEFPDLQGLNVTIPLKISIIPFLNRLSGSAMEVGAVNCIEINRSGSEPLLIGHNTDVTGFRNSLLPLLNDSHKQALILGTGGASRAVAKVLSDLRISFKLVSCNPAGTEILKYEQVSKGVIDKYTLIINTTPLGMYPQTGFSPVIPYQYLGNKHLLFDLVYNPDITLFMKKGTEAGARVCNGLKMLEMQAEASWEIWDDSTIR